MKKSEQTRLVKWLIVAALLIGSFLLIMFSGSRDSSEEDGEEIVVADLSISEDDNVKGSSDAKFELIEYSDFQCPACKTRTPVVEQVINEFGNHVQFAYRHFPLRRIHPNAQAAAEATEAAALQGEFWPMHDIIFENQATWSNMSTSEAKDAFASYAEEIGLDMEKFNQDVDGSLVEKQVNADYDSGVSAGVNSTPTFFLNGEKVNINTANYGQFREFLREEIKSDS